MLTRIPVTKNATAVHARHNKNVAPAIDLGCVAIVSSNADRKARQGFLIFVCLSLSLVSVKEERGRRRRRTTTVGEKKTQKKRDKSDARVVNDLSLSLSVCVCVCVSVCLLSSARPERATKVSSFCGQLGKFNCRNFSNVNPLFELEKLLCV